ncbi:ATP-grasp domain-containing protein [Novipirellula rosea]|uniref:ATP-grasp domain-containing protein n=1 Tax=Novipirellula rosea TaxID=1031540 RepID=UPI0031EE1E20
MTSVTWILESDVFPNSHGRLRKAISDADHRIVDSQDDWWLHEPPDFDPETPVIFHGSLGNAAVIEMKAIGNPGSFCPVNEFCCTAWYPRASRWLMHQDWRCLPANELIANATDVAAGIGCLDRVFVRPDSPLKPFSGRVLDVDSISLKALDHGFYYEEDTLPVIVAPVVEVGREWRFVVVQGRVVAGSGYDAGTRRAVDSGGDVKARDLADEVASSMPSPCPVYVLDVCQVGGEYHLIELNPFGGADLYDCDAAAIVSAVSNYAIQNHPL